MPAAQLIHLLVFFPIWRLMSGLRLPEESDGELMAWVSRERFRRYSKLDSFTLYSMGDTGSTPPIWKTIRRTR